MAAPRLYFFEAPAQAEPARIMYILSGVEFEDVRFTHETFHQYKAESPTGMAPFLQVEDGKTKIAELAAVLVYVAKSTGMLPEDPTAEAKVLAISFFPSNIYQAFRAVWQATEEERPKVGRHVIEEKLLPLLDTWEKLVKEVQTTPGYAYGAELTFADAVIYATVRFIAGYKAMHLDYQLDQARYPTLSKIFDNVANQKSVQKYSAEHPW